MAKQVQTRGFTLIEMCIVLSIISILMLLTPALLYNNSVFNFECEKIKDLIIGAKIKAQLNRSIINVTIKRSEIIINDQSFKLSKGIYCAPYQFHFNGKGNINMANTITCQYLYNEKHIVMNIGNGNIYVK